MENTIAVPSILKGCTLYIRVPCPVTWKTQHPRQLQEVDMKSNLVTIFNNLVLTIALIFIRNSGSKWLNIKKLLEAKKLQKLEIRKLRGLIFKKKEKKHC